MEYTAQTEVDLGVFPQAVNSVNLVSKGPENRNVDDDVVIIAYPRFVGKVGGSV